MGKVSIHLKKVLVIPLQAPLEPIDIGCPKTELFLPFDQEDKGPVIVLLFPDDIRSAIRRAVINNEYVKLAFQCHHGINHATYVLLFFVGRYDNQLVRQNV